MIKKRIKEINFNNILINVLCETNSIQQIYPPTLLFNILFTHFEYDHEQINVIHHELYEIRLDFTLKISRKSTFA